MAFPDDKTLTTLIRGKALELQFDLCGIAPSRPLSEHMTTIMNWCSAGMNGEMGYLCDDPGKRLNPELLFPGVKSVIVTGLNYYTRQRQGGNGVPVISRYAYGVNYHDVIKGRLNNLLEFIKINQPGAEGRAFVDSAPVLEKAWAREAGLGWPGKHSVLINDRIGSLFFIGILLVNTTLDYDKPYIADNCGSCRNCIEACPTEAINEDRTIDARKCISYLTVESKSPVPMEVIPRLGGRVFGCDRCQDVCPWNKNASETGVGEFKIPDEIVKMQAYEWLDLSKERFKSLFKKSAIGRRKYETFLENVARITKAVPDNQL